MQKREGKDVLNTYIFMNCISSRKFLGICVWFCHITDELIHITLYSARKNSSILVSKCTFRTILILNTFPWVLVCATYVVLLHASGLKRMSSHEFHVLFLDNMIKFSLFKIALCKAFHTRYVSMTCQLVSVCVS